MTVLYIGILCLHSHLTHDSIIALKDEPQLYVTATVTIPKWRYEIELPIW